MVHISLDNYPSSSRVKKHESPIQQIHLRLTTDLEALAEVLQQFEKLAASTLPTKIYWECQMALAEAFTNAVRHAHADLPPQTPIELEMKLFPTTLEIRIWDRGQFFDLDAKLAEVLQTPENPLQVGGRGLRWIHALMDDFTYTRDTQDRNCLFLRKHFLSNSP
ncbi:ATP-binding protein [Spirulina sp. CS-785/01]|uniref:ATP-binding protein n=1 Tax=Spirulina sp. CS-785/01 TaxID=3021716 RepID=UPI00233110CA|nr:ATP-binding protein [Spirulina sp. CS-785/01]MDB9312623.1 ATP-binding protein [Spirulina sp. CS-785/01]